METFRLKDIIFFPDTLLSILGEALKLYRNIARQYAYLYQRLQQVGVACHKVVLIQSFVTSLELCQVNSRCLNDQQLI